MNPDEAERQFDDEGNSGPDRRHWLGWSATAAMFAGLGAGYGTLARFAGQYLFTTQSDTAWLFVAPTTEFAPGQSLLFEAPTGVRVTITRRTASESTTESSGEPALDEFSALSSVCPHLGCQVHWEAANRRYFCPCHNGVFDPEGRAVEGPPAAANQELPRYPLRIERGLLFVELPLHVLGDRRHAPLENSLAAGDLSSSSADPFSPRLPS